MQFEVTNRREEKEGLVFKKPVYLANVAIRLTTEEFETLKTMAKEKQWKDYPLGEEVINEKMTFEITVAGLYEGAKKTGSYNRRVSAPIPEDRELRISELQEIASNAKQVIATRLSALSTSDDDVSIEI